MQWVPVIHCETEAWTRMTRIGRIFTDLIRADPSHPRQSVFGCLRRSCSVLLSVHFLFFRQEFHAEISISL